MMAVRIKATLATGETITGPIMGNGGMVGSGALCHGAKSAGRQALRSLRVAQSRAADGLHLPIFEPSPGHVAIYPDFSAATDGERIEIPLAGTTFSIEETP